MFTNRRVNKQMYSHTNVWQTLLSQTNVSTCKVGDLGRVGKIPWRRGRLLTPAFWPEEFHVLYTHEVTKSQTRQSNFHFTSLTQQTLGRDSHVSLVFPHVLWREALTVLLQTIFLQKHLHRGEHRENTLRHKSQQDPLWPTSQNIRNKSKNKQMGPNET